jgi:hypothetical protein
VGREVTTGAVVVILRDAGFMGREGTSGALMRDPGTKPTDTAVSSVRRFRPRFKHKEDVVTYRSMIPDLREKRGDRFARYRADEWLVSFLQDETEIAIKDTFRQICHKVSFGRGTRVLGLVVSMRKWTSRRPDKVFDVNSKLKRDR